MARISCSSRFSSLSDVSSISYSLMLLALGFFSVGKLRLVELFLIELMFIKVELFSCVFVTGTGLASANPKVLMSSLLVSVMSK